MKYLAPLVLLGALTLLPSAASAGECFSTPIETVDWTGTITSGVNVRTGPCTEKTDVVGVAKSGSLVAIVEYTAHYYHIVTPEGVQGWIYEGFINVSKTPFSGTIPEPVLISEPVKEEVKETTVEKKHTEKTHTKEVVSDSLIDRVAGHILLDVEDLGKAYYVDPESKKRYYMKDGETAYEMMRAFGLGITNVDFAKLQAGDASLKSRLTGKIVLKVEDLGKAYYIHPDGNLYYLADGPAAYEIMRKHSLGITNKDIQGIPEKTFVPLENKEMETSVKELSFPKETTTVPGTFEVSSFQKGIIPVGVDLKALNDYYLMRMNELRAEAGLRALVLDQRWVDTATEWASYMGETDSMTHSRPDGSSMHDWIDAKGLDFTQRHNDGGWKTNYFTENIAYGINEGTTAGVKEVIEDTIDFYLAEKASNGPHYRTIYHEDWNSMGSGFYFEDQGNGRYKISMAFHFGSLEV